MENKQLRWAYLFVLAIIWGSSFILMKKALLSFTPVQVGALRIVITSIFLLVIGFPKIFKITRRHWLYLFLNATIGTFIPVFLFAFAVSYIDSSIVSILNSLTPFNTLIFGALFFGFGFKKRQLFGVIVGLIGTTMLILKGAEINPTQNYSYASLILLATVCYALNVNIIKKYLHDLDALSITVGNFLIMVIPAFIILFFTGIFNTFEYNEATSSSIIYISILAVFGTGLAKILYNQLIQMSTPVFSSSVTYLIPIVAIGWGVLDGENITFYQVVSGFIILLGVYMVNKAK
jgi:drug/metabolite transporter (DMT)-like permease